MKRFQWLSPIQVFFYWPISVGFYWSDVKYVDLGFICFFWTGFNRQ